MSEPIDLDGPPACPECGAPMRVAEWPGEGLDGASLWSAACIEKGECHWEVFDRMERPTWRTEPGWAPLVAEIERLRAEAAEAERARGLIERAVGCKGGPPTLLNLSTVVEVLAERYAEVGGDALWGGRACGLDPDEMVGDDGEVEE